MNREEKGRKKEKETSLLFFLKQDKTKQGIFRQWKMGQPDTSISHVHLSLKLSFVFTVCNNMIKQ